jgi:hypothetical protein
VRCALEDDVSGDIRPDKLVQVIRESPPLHSRSPSRRAGSKRAFPL